MKDVVVAEKGYVYECPFCNGLVRSNIDLCATISFTSRTVQSDTVSKQTRCHAHSCPVCSTVVWSSQSCGRSRVMHDMPSGKRCHNKQWHVPDTHGEKTKKVKDRLIPKEGMAVARVAGGSKRRRRGFWWFCRLANSSLGHR